MSAPFEDPAIPLVSSSSNGNLPMYTKAKKQPIRKFDNVGYRLAKRKELFKRRKIISDFAFGFAIVGIVLMVAETESCMAHAYSKSSTASMLVKSCITVSTTTLLGFVVWYHILDIKLFMCDNSVEDWRLAMSGKRIFKILIELCVYALHPLPANFEYVYNVTDPETHIIHQNTVPVDVILSIPMFMRFYLLCRVLMLHSRLFTDASSQSLGALNRIHFNFSFIFKSMMTLYPEYVLTILMLSVFMMASWLLRACEMYHDSTHANFLDSMWLVAITFLSVGYGDITPISYCGRTICVLTGIFGAGCTALVVAVLARKLELSRAEKYVHNFVIDVELDKRFRHAAADILKAGWFVFKNKKKGYGVAVRRHQRKLLKAIHAIRDVKEEQSRLADASGERDPGRMNAEQLSNLVSKVEKQHIHVESTVNSLLHRIERLDIKLDAIGRAVMA